MECGMVGCEAKLVLLAGGEATAMVRLSQFAVTDAERNMFADIGYLPYSEERWNAGIPDSGLDYIEYWG
jgi:hypothetical protein